MLKFAILLSFFTAAAAIAGASSPEATHGKNVNSQHQKEKEPFFPPKIANKEMATRPASPELVEPAFMATVTGATVLKWKEVPAATNYHVQVATDPNFKWLVVDQPSYTGTSFDLKNLNPGKHYYWRVAGQKSSNDPAYTKSAFTKSMFETK